MIKYKCPLLIVNDIEKSRNFYEKILKQKVKDDYGEILFFQAGFVLQLKRNFESLINVKSNIIKFGSKSFELYFETDNIDNLYNRLIEEKIELLHETRVQPWKQRVVRFYDPDKHIIEVGETMDSTVQRLYKQGYSSEEIVNKCSMPKNFVEQIIKSSNKKKNKDNQL